MSDEVTLRLVREDDLPMLEELTQDPGRTGEFEWFGWSDLRRWRRGWEDNGLISQDGGTLVVARGHQRLGLVNWRRQPITQTAYCWEIGIILLPEARGHGYGTQAQRLLARYLFAHTTAHRIWAGTEVGNLAEQRALEKAGFTREGVTRATGWRDGAWRDGVIYSLLRTDPAMDETGWTRAPGEDHNPDVRAAIAGELRLLEPSVRQTPAQAETLLHPDFFEFGASGRRWDRAEMLAALAAERVPHGQAAVATAANVAGIRLADGFVLVTYVSQDETRRCRRSSIWRRTTSGWRMFFHQGTIIPDEVP